MKNKYGYDPLKFQTLKDYLDMNNISLEDEINKGIINVLDDIYKKYVPKEQQKLIDYKLDILNSKSKDMGKK